MGDAPKLVLDFLDFPPFRITFKLLYCRSGQEHPWRVGGPAGSVQLTNQTKAAAFLVSLILR